MKILKTFYGLIVLLIVVASLNACSSTSTSPNPAAEAQLSRQTEQIQRLQAAEYQDYLNAMRFEDNDQRLGNYYSRKGAKAHLLIDRLEKGHQVNDEEISRALDTSDSEKYDDRPPVPLDDETGNGY